ncbi:MAG TPA: MarR family transcriptional regulator [Gemmatimonadales bacterium]|nr:MarR family transcriptional regulator [Gemmatimonadales bacterium]
MKGTARAEPGRDLCVLLSRASHALTLELTAALTAVGISPRAYCVLSHALTGELTQRELAERCDLDKTTMVVTVDELERAGLVERRPSKTDRRARIIAVTDAGRKVVRQGQEILARVYDDVLSALPVRQREAFVDGLVRLVHGPLSAPAQCERPVRRRAVTRARSSRNR